MNYYELIGVDVNATPEEITAAYRKAQVQFHPDKNLNNPDEAKLKFIKATEAYETLIDFGKRAKYNKTINLQPKPAKAKPKKKKPSGLGFVNIFDLTDEEILELDVGGELKFHTPPPPKFDIWGKKIEPKHDPRLI
jgi:DnaJ-class molecular chaperone